MKLQINTRVLKKVTGWAEDAAQSALYRVRLEQEIRDLQEEIHLQMQAVGESVYSAHRGGPDEGVEEILEYVDGLYEQLAAHQREWKIMRGLLACPACGEANDRSNLYCHNCGRALSLGGDGASGAGE